MTTAAQRPSNDGGTDGDMGQPVPRKVKEKNPEFGEEKFTTLLVDGSNILELSCKAVEEYNSRGISCGGVGQFLLQLRMMLAKGSFRHVYVFWDGENSGQLRYNLYSDYKVNRDKDYEEEGLSDYMKAVNARVRSMTSYFKEKDVARNGGKPKRQREDKEDFFRQREVVMELLEEIFVRQCVCDMTEADDFIGYYVTHKKPNERIVIMSNDRDLTQLISEDVIVYVQSMKKFLTVKNHREEMGYHYGNVLLKKMICGDASDNIKGVKGVGEKTLFDNFPGFIDRKMTLQEVIDGARELNERRVEEKKKPLVWARNLAEGVTDGVQGEKLYDINRKIIDLSHPLMTTEAVELIDSMMHQPLDPDGRSFENAYRIMCEKGPDEFRSTDRFAGFFNGFSQIRQNEMNFSAGKFS